VDTSERASQADTGEGQPQPPTSSPLLEEAGQALFRLGRFFARESMQRVVGEGTGRSTELSRALVVQAVEPGPAGPEQEVTVGLVAERLGIDPSTASRLVAETLRAGYLTRAASPLDARRVRLELTDAGRELAENVRRYQGAVFEQVTRDWSDRERQEFARLFITFAQAVAEHTASVAASGASRDGAR
jgi:DNA-binding MarR family transcriptional regulator